MYNFIFLLMVTKFYLVLFLQFMVREVGSHPVSQYTSSPYLYNEVWRWDVPWEGAEVDPNSSLLMGCKLGIILVIQGDAG